MIPFCSQHIFSFSCFINPLAPEFWTSNPSYTEKVTEKKNSAKANVFISFILG